MPQSLRRKMVSFLPKPLACASLAILSMAAWLSRPEYGPEFMLTPYSVKGAVGGGADFSVAAETRQSGDWRSRERPVCVGAAITTTGFGKLYFVANSKSRWSWAGTAMMAPVPYSIRTKLPTQIGSCELLKGLTA